MYVITGANGQTGSITAQTLLQQGQPVRVVLRRAEQAEAWLARGAQVAIADMADSAALARAFDGATAAYLMNPPAYQAQDLFGQASKVHAALIAAAEQAGLAHVVALSSVGAQHAAGTGNILTTHDFERQLRASRLRVTVLRAANFIENWAWSLPVARQQGRLPSMFHPLAQALPMVSIHDIGATAASLLQQASAGIVELHGPRDYSPIDAAQALSQLLGQPVEAVATPASAWPGIFEASGFSAGVVQAFCEMFDGFNRGHTVFEGSHRSLRGTVGLEQALGRLPG